MSTSVLLECWWRSKRKVTSEEAVVVFVGLKEISVIYSIIWSIFTFLSLMKPYLNAYILVDEGVTSSSTVLPTNSTVCLPSILQETRRKASKVKQVIWNEILKLTAVK